MDDLVAFLRARLDEDEAAAKCILEDPDYQAAWHEQSSGVLYVGPGSEQHPLDGLVPMGDSRLTRFIACHDPARTLREVAADRRLLAEVGKLAGDIGWDDAVMFAVKCRVSVYHGHPDYRQEWAPDGP